LKHCPDRAPSTATHQAATETAGVDEVHRDPAHGRYHTVRSCAAGEELRPVSVPEIALRPAMLWQAG
jgi:hypothetical protein